MDREVKRGKIDGHTAKQTLENVLLDGQCEQKRKQCEQKCL